MIEEMLDANVIEPTAFAWLLQIYQFAEGTTPVHVINVLLSSSNLLNLSMRFRDLVRKYFFTIVPKEINAVN